MKRPFGRLPDGRDVEAITLGDADGLQVEVLTYGAILRRITVPVRGARRDVILALDDLEAYVRDRAYVGSLVGRFGNRIADSAFTLDGVRHSVSANEGANHLHGGHLGFGKRLWRVLGPVSGARLSLGLTSPDGEEGYPGQVEANVELEVRPNTLAIALTARTTAPTPINLTYHPYFNLAGPHVPAVDQALRIPASHYLPVRPGLIPTGELAPVAGTTFDFRTARRLAPPALDTHPQLAPGGGYDHCWVLDADADCACELSSRDLALTIRGSGPGLQFYNGQFLSKTHPAIGSGVILEPQGLPDAPNQPGFPPAILRPGETYRATIDYELRAL
ncbi:MAG TPA: aldose epimerase family protein [Steroidobacteraceae bacterium]|nr:aldose epimerase family protein [Steroidobacteraceae bacterium]